mgnify:CR=1 FL=1|tara:strand:+ start:89 stop:637 length:549 start_codon:yes stop_codon:yes gene_type:complete
MLEVERLVLEGPVVLRPQIHSDTRGYFFESFNSQVFKKCVGENINFVQDNESLSQHGTLRGLHFQTDPRAQGKLVRVTEGKIFDVAVDLRKASPTFGKWLSVELSDYNKKQLWVPRGFAHGFLTLSESAKVLYKTTDFYSPDHEQTIKWDDEFLDIKWPDNCEKLVSEKDTQGLAFREVQYF